MSVDWFRRLADVPDVGYQGSPGIDPGTLKGHAVEPTLGEFPSDVRVDDLARKQYLSWPSGSSPAHERAIFDQKHMSTEEVLRNIAEALELPGQPRDYHFAIQLAAEALWNRRRAEPEVLDEVERLCWLDIRLVEALPSTIRVEPISDGTFAMVAAFKILVTLYEREGAIREALEVAVLAEGFGQHAEKAEELRERLAVLEAEDA
ncbi:MAG: hypothetical protein M3256_03440 [Actinomycetota bacterium]|nr:hypothetical protein [Actinomycetota bacterium]